MMNDSLNSGEQVFFFFFFFVLNFVLNNIIVYYYDYYCPCPSHLYSLLQKRFLW